MGEFLDFGANMLAFVTAVKGYEKSNSLSVLRDSDIPKSRRRKIARVDPRLYNVRDSICIAGSNYKAVLRVKTFVDKLTETPFKVLESFHIKTENDVKDGALLVPKVILVAVYCPGRKLLDDFGNEGQLDHAYDEIAELGADIMVIYLDLPKIIYPRVNNTLFHPRVADLLFPSQTLLQSLAMDGAFMSVTERSDFNQLQKNMLCEWVMRPIDPRTHQVYKSADNLRSKSEAEWLSENEACYYRRDRGEHSRENARGFVSAIEVHPVVDKKKKSKSKIRKAYYGSMSRSSRVTVRHDLIPLIDADLDDFDQLELALDDLEKMETELNNDYSYQDDTKRRIDV